MKKKLLLLKKIKPTQIHHVFLWIISKCGYFCFVCWMFNDLTLTNYST